MSRRHAPWPLRYAVLAIAWGSTFLFIKIGDEAFSPLQVSLGRTLVGSVTLLAITGLRGERMPGSSPRLWGKLVLAAILLNVAPFTLFAYGERHVSSVLAGIWNATVPLFTLPVALLALSDEHASARRLLGLSVGFAGVLTVLGVWRGLGATSLSGNLLCLGAAASYGLGFPYARRYLARDAADPLTLATAQLICGTILLAILTPLFTSVPHGVHAKHVLAVLALGVFGTGLTFALNYSLIGEVGATVTSTVAYVMPIVSTVLGVVALGEPLRWYQPIGAVVIIAGAVLAQARNRAAPAPADGDDLSSVLLRRPASAAPRSTRAWD